jgi:hypothetical protein
VLHPIRPCEQRSLGARESRRLLLLCGAWLLCVASSFTAFALYKAQPNDMATGAIGLFPRGSSIVLAATKPTLIVFVHPRCACSRASLAEFRKLLAELGSGVAARIVVQGDRESNPAASTSDITREAFAISSASAQFDHGAREASRFGVKTSGHALLYGPDGRLLYSGGLTNSRGHEGPSLGRAHLLSVLAANVHHVGQEKRAAPVYGCGIQEGSRSSD